MSKPCARRTASAQEDDRRRVSLQLLGCQMYDLSWYRWNFLIRNEKLISHLSSQSRLFSPWVIGFESSHIRANSVSVKTRRSLKWRSGCLTVRFSVVCCCDRAVGGMEEHISTSLRRPKQTALWRLELLSVRTKIPQLPRSHGILLLSLPLTEI